MSEDNTSNLPSIIQIEDVTLEQLVKIVAEMQHAMRNIVTRYDNVIKIIKKNTKTYNEFRDGVLDGFTQRDEMIKKLLNTQHQILREINPIVGEFKRGQAEMMKVMFKASDRGKKFDN